MTRVIPTLLLAAFLFGLPRPAAADAPPRDPAPAGEGLAHVTYLVGNSVYIDAGSDMGLAEGMAVEVIRDGTRIADLTVTYLSTRRASCSIVASTGEILVGDAVRFTASAPVPVPVSTETGGGNRVPGSSWRDAGIRGRLGLRYLTLQDRSGRGESFFQPAFDVSLRGTRIGGSPYDLMIDIRAKTTYRTRTAGENLSRDEFRVYRLCGSRGGRDDRWRFSVGRLVSTNFSSMSLIDGGLAEWQPSRLSLGVFGGTHPDADLGFSSKDAEFGVYARWSDSGTGDMRYATTLGWVRSQESGSFNREFLLLKGFLAGRGFHFFASQEIDVNRGWKTDVESGSLSWTSTYVNLRYRVSRSLSLRAGYDNRRRVRLYRDRETPESSFDDSYRQGFRAGVDGRVGRLLRAGLQFTTNGGVSGDSRSYTGTLGLPDLPLAVDLSSRHTRYTGPWAEGWLHLIRLGRSLGSRVEAGAWWGTRSEEQTLALSSRNTLTWLGMDADVALGRGWHLFVSGESTTSDVEDNGQIHTSLSYRF